MLLNAFNNILIVRTDRIGDVVLTTPAIKALRKAYPTARISILVSPATKDLVEGNPYIDEVLVDERNDRYRGILGALFGARELRKRKFDVAFIFHTKRRYNAACFLAGIPMRIGYKDDKYGFFLTHPIKDIRLEGSQHEAQYCLDILRQVGIKTEEMDFLVPTDNQAERWASEWMISQSIKNGQLVAIHPGASDPCKCWPAQKFAKLIDSLQQRYFITTVLIGSAQTKDICSEILKLTTTYKPIDLSGQVSLAQTISLLRRCRLLVSNDSGPVHLAVAVDIYVISLFMRNQPGVNPERWKPLSDKGFYLYSPQGIEVEEVLEKVEQIFSKDHQEFFHW